MTFRASTNGADAAEIEGNTVGEALDALCKKFDGIDKRLFRSPRELNRFVNVYVNDEDIRFLQHLDTPLSAGDDLTIVPAIAGG